MECTLTSPSGETFFFSTTIFWDFSAPAVEVPDDERFTPEDLLAWARTKPAHEHYNYTDPVNCAVGQFGRDTERKHLVGLVNLELYYPDINKLVSKGRWTFGALAARLAAFCSQPTPKEDATTMAASPRPDWTTPSAYCPNAADCPAARQNDGPTDGRSAEPERALEAV